MRQNERRALSFESNPLGYEAFRPGYPAVLVDRLVELAGLSRSSRVLEIGCGTGKATALLAARGFEIHCIDPGQKLVAIARRECRQWPRVTFEVGRYEDAVVGPGTYDLLFSAQAFHWIDPAVRWRKSHEILVSNGSLALLYNYSPLPETPRERDLMELIRTLSRGAMKPSDHEDAIRSWVAQAESTGLFRDVSVHRHRWTQRYATERYIGLFGTYSDFRQMDAETQGVIVDGMRRFLRDHGGHTDRLYESVLIHGKRTSVA